MASQKRWTEMQGLHILKDEPGLRAIVLDISDICNFDCLYCYGKSEAFEQKGNLTLENYFALFEESKELGVESFWFLGGHENTLSPDYLKMVQRLEDLGLYSITLTNGAGFGNERVAQGIHGMSSKEFTEEVARCRGASVILKTDSLDEEVQNTISGKAFAYQQIQTALINIMASSLYSAKESRLPRFGINSVLTKMNYQDIGKVFDFALENRLVYFCDDLLDTGNAERNKDRIAISEEERRECLSGIEKTLQKHGLEAKPKDVVNFYDKNCILFDNYIFVLSNGNVIPCAAFSDSKTPLGNIREGLDKIKDAKLGLVSKYYSDCSSYKKCPCRAYLEDDFKS
ncbi:radical SAM protein [Nanoarchaeota archaeon]